MCVYDYHAQQICTEQVDEDTWEAWLEYDDEGMRATGATAHDAAVSLRDMLDAEGADLAEMRIMADDDRAHAARDRRMGL